MTGKIINKFSSAVKKHSYTRSRTQNVCLLSQNWKICHNRFWFACSYCASYYLSTYQPPTYVSMWKRLKT